MVVGRDFSLGCFVVVVGRGCSLRRAAAVVGVVLVVGRDFSLGCVSVGRSSYSIVTSVQGRAAPTRRVQVHRSVHHP